VVASVHYYAVVCWGGSIKKTDIGQLDRLRAGSVVGSELDSLITVATLDKLLPILNNTNHPLHNTFIGQRIVFSGRLLSQPSSTNKLKNSGGIDNRTFFFLPPYCTLYFHLHSIWTVYIHLHFICTFYCFAVFYCGYCVISSFYFIFKYFLHFVFYWTLEEFRCKSL